MSERGADGPAADAARSATVVLDVRHPSISQRLLVPVARAWTVRRVKDEISAAMHKEPASSEGWPQPQGLRCIYQGRLLANDTTWPDTDADTMPVHIVVQPEAWVPRPAAAEAALAAPDDHGATPQRPPRADANTSQNPLLDDAAAARVRTQTVDAQDLAAKVPQTHDVLPPAEALAPQPPPSRRAPSPTGPRTAATAPTPLSAAARERLASLPPAQIAVVGEALCVAAAAYTAYAQQLQDTFPDLPSPPRPVRAPGSWAAAAAATDARGEALELVEAHVMRWQPLSELSHDARAHVRTAHRWVYEPRMIHGLPYLLRTCVQATPQSARALAEEAHTRVDALQDALGVLWERAMSAAPAAPAAPPQAAAPTTVLALTADDWLSLVHLLFDMSWRILLVLLLFYPYGTIWHKVVLGGAVAAYIVLTTHRHLQERWRQRMPSAPESEAPAPAPAPPAHESGATLELPRLPSRVPTASMLYWEHWAQRIAWLGLEDEERAIGFTHAPRTSPARIVWDTYAWDAAPAQSTQSSLPPPPPPPPPHHWPRPAWQRYVVLPCQVLALTLVPSIEAMRTEAIAMRREAIAALARRYERLRTSYDGALAAPPVILQHPYARAVLAAQR